ncbi:protein kinase family protein [Aspergillus lucknowensis]|uniref:Kinase-like protein n=1 Tax=Aspergillus lucknowensis TaxID=176173 RepID=A0ABR4LWP2_9EURO
MPATPPPSHVSARDSLDFIAAGTVSVVYALNEDWVIKRSPKPNDSFALSAYDIEQKVYRRLGTHPRIAQCRAITDDGLELERGDCLRQILSSRQNKIESHTRLQWALEAAEGLQYIHEKGIIHADIGCHNLLIDRSGHIKFIDFAGSSLDGNEPLVCYEWCSYRPCAALDIKTDIFAFGSTLFEIETGNLPFHELQEGLSSWELMRAAEERFTARDYPDMDMMQLRHVITRCWNGEYESMVDVRGDIATCWQE